MKKSIAEVADKAYKLGKEYEKTYRGCSQCVMAGLQDALEIRNDDLFKAATGLAGGTGLTGDVIGKFFQKFNSLFRILPV